MNISAYAIHDAMRDLEDAYRDYDRAHPDARWRYEEPLQRAFTAYAALVTEAAASTIPASQGDA